MVQPAMTDPTDTELDYAETMGARREVRIVKALRACRTRSKAKDAVVKAVRGDKVDLSAYRSDLHVYGDLGTLCTALSVWSNQQPETGDYRKALKIASLYLENIWEALAALDKGDG